nr:substrate binding domain-containing protein [Salinisphaera sp.]
MWHGTARRGTPNMPENLTGHNCLMLSTLDQFNDRAFEDSDSGRRVLRVHGSFRSNTADGLHEAVRSGVGLARLSNWLVAPDLAVGRLVAVLPQYPHDYSAFYVLYPHRRHLSRKVRAFVDFLIEKFTPVPHWELDG